MTRSFVISRVHPDDAGAWDAYLVRNAEHLASTTPTLLAADDRSTRERIAACVDEWGDGGAWWLARDGGAAGADIVGSIRLSNVSRGCWQNATVGYSVDAAHLRRGVASAMLEHALEQAFGALALHRVEASTRPDNLGSQRVLERAGFERIGVSRDHLHIAGAWRDHVLWSIVAP